MNFDDLVKKSTKTNKYIIFYDLVTKSIKNKEKREFQLFWKEIDKKLKKP
jgi:hypothetical protein